MTTPNISAVSAETIRRGTPQAEPVQQRPFIAPAVDVFESDHDVVVLADLPGVAKDDLSVHLEGGKLFFEAGRSNANPGAPLTTEYRLCDYRRSFLVPQSIDASKIEAELKSGVLHIRLPKTDALKPRKIEIKAS